MNLMDVKRMNLVCCVRNTPMGVGPYHNPSHGLLIRGELPVVDVETFLVFAKLHHKVGGTPLQLISDTIWQWLVYGFVVESCFDGPDRRGFLSICIEID